MALVGLSELQVLAQVAAENCSPADSKVLAGRVAQKMEKDWTGKQDCIALHTGPGRSSHFHALQKALCQLYSYVGTGLFFRSGSR